MPKPEDLPIVIPNQNHVVAEDITSDNFLQRAFPNGEINRNDPQVMALVIAETTVNLLNTILLKAHAAGIIQITNCQISGSAILMPCTFRTLSPMTDQNVTNKGELPQLSI